MVYSLTFLQSHGEVVLGCGFIVGGQAPVSRDLKGLPKGFVIGILAR